MNHNWVDEKLRPIPGYRCQAVRLNSGKLVQLCGLAAPAQVGPSIHLCRGHELLHECDVSDMPVALQEFPR